ncbi:hypothetical protein [Novipirellula artificiosorum]|uniref:hypothetical protein n=1 Tax=Novipirellula artificiosorum TaxID=2528016 RepID=UPI0011B61508|nr:hypothetical protein [Novipirellula artificiosorum]
MDTGAIPPKNLESGFRALPSDEPKVFGQTLNQDADQTIAEKTSFEEKTTVLLVTAKPEASLLRIYRDGIDRLAAHKKTTPAID